MSDIIIEGIPELFAKLGAAAAISTLRPPMQRSVMRIHNRIAIAPPPIPPGLWAAKTSRKQKAFFFAALRRGQIDGSRTGTLARRWLTKVETTSTGLTGTIGNNTGYGPWVQSSMFQVGFHVGRWVTDREVVQKEEGAIVADFDIAIQAVLR